MAMHDEKYLRNQGLYDPRHEHDACGMGFVASIGGRKSHQMVLDALSALERLEHRGAVGFEEDTGDGAGMLLQIPDRLMQAVTPGLGIELPQAGDYAVAMLFLPPQPAMRDEALKGLRRECDALGQRYLGLRPVPRFNHAIGPTARSVEPFVAQAFIGRAENTPQEQFEAVIYQIRKRFEAWLDASNDPVLRATSLSSMSANTLVYKGMLKADQLRGYYPDLSHPECRSAIVLFHSRFSTNTFPSWSRAHPHRMTVHNGEFNTVRGNRNWMVARERLLSAETLGGSVEPLLPIVSDEQSDSESFDAVLELLVMAGRPLYHAVLMMIPEAWENNPALSAELRAFYRYHNSMMEPWDGPASVGFSDGRYVGAVLDRNGLRPSRSILTRDGRIMVASEVGVFDVEPDNILRSSRLKPGRMLLVDTQEGRLITDGELKQDLATAWPYLEWIQNNQRRADALRVEEKKTTRSVEELRARQVAVGYTDESTRLLLYPMAKAGKESLGSMGDDTPLAVLSRKPRLLYDYFRQLFAQVTNPPLDAIREAMVTSLETTIGPEGNLLDPKDDSCSTMYFETPLLDSGLLGGLREAEDFDLCTIDCCFDVDESGESLAQALERITPRGGGRG